MSTDIAAQAVLKGSERTKGAIDIEPVKLRQHNPQRCSCRNGPGIGQQAFPDALASAQEPRNAIAFGVAPRSAHRGEQNSLRRRIICVGPGAKRNYVCRLDGARSCGDNTITMTNSRLQSAATPWGLFFFSHGCSPPVRRSLDRLAVFFEPCVQVVFEVSDGAPELDVWGCRCPSNAVTVHPCLP